MRLGGDARERLSSLDQRAGTSSEGTTSSSWTKGHHSDPLLAVLNAEPMVRPAHPRVVSRSSAESPAPFTLSRPVYCVEQAYQPLSLARVNLGRPCDAALQMFTPLHF